jgi:hypothetical protein
MSHERNGNDGKSNGAPTRFIPPRSTDERGRLLPVSDEQRQAMVASWDETVRELEGMTDETDTPEVWDEVLRNLGVDPATGRGLETRREIRIARSTSVEVLDREQP